MPITSYQAHQLRTLVDVIEKAGGLYCEFRPNKRQLFDRNLLVFGPKGSASRRTLQTLSWSTLQRKACRKGDQQKAGIGWYFDYLTRNGIEPAPHTRETYENIFGTDDTSRSDATTDATTDTTVNKTNGDTSSDTSVNKSINKMDSDDESYDEIPMSTSKCHSTDHKFHDRFEDLRLSEEEHDDVPAFASSSISSTLTSSRRGHKSNSSPFKSPTKTPTAPSAASAAFAYEADGSREKPVIMKWTKNRNAFRYHPFDIHFSENILQDGIKYKGFVIRYAAQTLDIKKCTACVPDFLPGRYKKYEGSAVLIKVPTISHHSGDLAEYVKKMKATKSDVKDDSTAVSLQGAKLEIEHFADLASFYYLILFPTHSQFGRLENQILSGSLENLKVIRTAMKTPAKANSYATDFLGAVLTWRIALADVRVEHEDDKEIDKNFYA